MKNITLEYVKDTILKDDINKKDIQNIPLSKIKMDKTGQLKIGNRSSQLTDFATTQLFNFLGMTRVGYFKDLLDHQANLVAPIANYELQRKIQVTKNKKKDEKQMLFRTRKVDNGYLVRGFLSSSYSIFDNKDTIKSLETILKNIPNHEIVSFDLTDRMFHMRVVINDLKTIGGETLNGEDDILKVGVDIVNSEVGCSSLKVYPIVYRLVCQNGLKAWRQDGEVFEQRHVHLRPKEIEYRMNEALIASLKLGDEFIEKFIKTKEVKLNNPMKVIEELAKQNKYSEKLADKVKEAYTIEPMKNAYGVINAFTRASQQLTIENRLEMENFAGSLVDNPKKLLKLAV